MARTFTFISLLLQLSDVLGQSTPPTQVPQLPLQHVINQSAEYRLRKNLFTNYDKMVRPVLKPADVINVTFQVDLKALSAVDNKDQIVTTETAITQTWTNPFLQWNPVGYEGIKHILVDPKTIWVPDIVLENNADNQVLQAGHVEKFRTFVVVKSNGENMWEAPATFKSSCELNVKFFPFDKQQCNMKFRSLTADLSLMNIDSKEIKSEDPEKELKLTSSNGYWSLRSLVVKVASHTDEKGRQFREVTVSFFIGRKPMFFVLFTLVPCMIIGMLILVSFFIPAESGERIGLCATILLAVSVYLLVITDQLPEQSDTLPLIGVYYIVIMFEIGLALTATVLVLMAHHATSKPPKFLTYLTVLNRIVCSPRSCRKFISKRRSKDIPLSPTWSGAPATGERDNSDVESSDCDVELADTKKIADDEKQQDTEDRRRSNAESIITVNKAAENEENQEMWKEIGRALDRIFFWLFLTMFVLSTIVIYGQAGRLSSLDKFKF